MAGPVDTWANLAPFQVHVPPASMLVSVRDTFSSPGPEASTILFSTNHVGAERLEKELMRCDGGVDLKQLWHKYLSSNYPVKFKPSTMKMPWKPSIGVRVDVNANIKCSFLMNHSFRTSSTPHVFVYVPSYFSGLCLFLNYGHLCFFIPDCFLHLVTTANILHNPTPVESET